MQRIASHDRPNISDTVAATLRAMIVDGRLEAGARINEVHLSSALGISRTPLREALIRLSAEGALNSLPRLGFYVCPLTVQELEQIYPIRAILDPAALRLAGIPSRARLAELVALNRSMAHASDPQHVIELDDRWHLALLAGCPNTILIALIEQFMARTRRYELALMRARTNVAATTGAHQRVIKALRAGDLDAACVALRDNMESGKAPILAWLSERSATPL